MFPVKKITVGKILKLWENRYLIILSIHILKLEISGCDTGRMLLSLQQRHLFLSTSPPTTSPLVTMRISHLLQSQFSESVGHTTMRQEAPPCQARERQSHWFPWSQLLRCLARPAHLTDSGHGCSVSGDTPGAAADAGSVPAVPGVTAGNPRGDPSTTGGSEAADATTPDVDFTDVHLHAWLPWSALPAVRTSATSAPYHYRATGWPDSASSSSGWVRECSPVDFPTVTFAVPQTTTPHAAVTTSFLAQLQMTTPASSQLVSPLTTGALIIETPARTTLPSPLVSSPLSTFTTPRARAKVPSWISTPAGSFDAA
jgi:hypothetical protein